MKAYKESIGTLVLLLLLLLLEVGIKREMDLR
jgi:hypothetical protein